MEKSPYGGHCSLVLAVPGVPALLGNSLDVSEPTYSLRARGGKPNKSILYGIWIVLWTLIQIVAVIIWWALRLLFTIVIGLLQLTLHNYDIRNHQLGKGRVKVQCKSWAVAISLDGK